MSGQDINDEFMRTINQWRSTLFTDSPQVRSIYSHAAAYVLKRLEHCCDPEEWENVRQDFVEFQATIFKEMDHA